MKGVLPEQVLCELLNVSRSGYYRRQRARPSPRQEQDGIVAEQVAQAHARSRHSYGAPRVVSFTNVFGVVMYGAPAFAARQAEVLKSFFKGTAKKHTIRRIRFVTADVAIVDIDNEVRGVKAMPAGIPVPREDIIRRS